MKIVKQVQAAVPKMMKVMAHFFKVQDGLAASQCNRAADPYDNGFQTVSTQTKWHEWYGRVCNGILNI